ncbi:glycosyltransferase family 2 protein [Mucilaginibacter boryungensis]|uniref:Glycosyltransferase family 2 protein n=1 Tax=Mucilaginibacter boryungensis TaxID=768480 RepID=A0ABR9XEM9_9SPHI|nr:glycosyltransferase [Mucilaginibacter boryungensis]MBE9665837.1 glycosyltransferase family 2 protein [Mucilaginibacter boryungensis]
MKVAFICVNYNNSKITQEYVKSVLNIKGSYEVIIIVVDNASEKHDVQALEELNHSQMILIKSQTNVGYFKGLNLGIQAIRPKEFDFIFVSNNDLTFDVNILKNLEQLNIEDSTLVLAPNIIRIDGVHQNPHIVNKFSAIQKIYRRVYFMNYYIASFLQLLYNRIKPRLVSEDRVGYNQTQTILMGYGACYILTSFFFNYFKELDAPVFLMGEEGILANQVLSVNGTTLYCHDLLVTHHDHTSIGKVGVKKMYKYSKQSYKYYLKYLKHVQ